MPEVNLTDWNQFSRISSRTRIYFKWVSGVNSKKTSAGNPSVLFNNEVGAQILFRRLPLGLTIGYHAETSVE